jgi:tRNA (adenine-N(1)-)-methyltransferase non-catalytic subunit
MERSEITRDNREIVDTSTSQKLKTEDIEEKKRGGLLGSDMIDLLVENSSTFAAKSEYSQQKYIRKKIKKYADRITLLKPTVRLVSEIFFASDPIGIM